MGILYILSNLFCLAYLAYSVVEFHIPPPKAYLGVVPPLLLRATCL